MGSELAVPSVATRWRPLNVADQEREGKRLFRERQHYISPRYLLVMARARLNHGEVPLSVSEQCFMLILVKAHVADVEEDLG